MNCQGNRSPLVNWRSLESRMPSWNILVLLQLETFGWDILPKQAWNLSNAVSLCDIKMYLADPPREFKRSDENNTNCSISFLCRKWTDQKYHLRMWRASISKCSLANKRKSSIAGLKCSSMSHIWSVFPSFKQTATTMVHKMKSQAQDRLPPVWLLTWLLSSWMPFLTKGASLIPKAKLPSNSKRQAKISKLRLKIVFYLFDFQIWLL